MADRWEPLTGDAAALAVATAEALLRSPGPLLAEVDAAVLDAALPLAADPELTAVARDTDHANVIRWLTATAKRPGAPVGPDLTPEALEIGREIVRRGIDRAVLTAAYRQGQNVCWRLWMQRMAQEAARSSAGTEVLVEALDATARTLFAYVDDILTGVDAQIEREREQLLGAHLAQRLETVQLVLQGAPIPETRASSRLGYELGGRHVALVLWHGDQLAEPGVLERVAGRLARVAGAHRAFTLPAGATTMWAWMTTDEAPDAATLRAALDDGDEVDEDVRVALGSHHAGMAGFRRSHQDALEVQRLVRHRPGVERLTSYADVEVAVVASADPVRAHRFVEATLGPLLDERDAVRETLRVHLQEQASATRAARRLFTHRNTVLKRVARADELLPAPWQERSLAVALALELDHWLPPSETTDPG